MLKLDLTTMNPAVLLDRENLIFGHSSTLLWTGVDPLALCAAGNIDSNGDEDENDRWRLGYTCANIDLVCPSSRESSYYFSNPVSNSRDSSTMINNLEIETDFNAGERWLFGTSRGLDVAYYSAQTYFFKVKLNSGETSMDDGT